MRRWRVVVMLAIATLAAGCSTIDATIESFVAPDPPDEFASGLSIGFIPEGYVWVWNEGHETAVFHVFQTSDESGQLSVGIQLDPPDPGEDGTTVERNGRQFVVYEGGSRVTEDVGDSSRIDVVSNTLEVETLIDIAASVSYDSPTD